MKLRVKEILKTKQISQKEMADRMGIMPESLSRIIPGNPSLSTLENMAKALNVNISDLFDNEIDEKRISGYIEIDNVIHKITSKDDFDKIHKLLKK